MSLINYKFKEKYFYYFSDKYFETIFGFNI